MAAFFFSEIQEMNIFKQLSSYFERSLPQNQVSRPAMPPVYKRPPTTEHGLRFTEQVTPSNMADLSRAINRPIKRPVYTPIFRPEKGDR